MHPHYINIISINFTEESYHIWQNNITLLTADKNGPFSNDTVVPVMNHPLLVDTDIAGVNDLSPGQLV